MAGHCIRSIVAISAFTGAACAVLGQAPPPLTGVRYAQGFTGALFIGAPSGDYNRIFVLEQAGRIRLIKNGVVQTTDFLNISGLTNTNWLEWGLLGIAFDPDYANNRTFYIYHTDTTAAANTVIARYQASAANPDVADPTTRDVIMIVPQTTNLHRAGWMDFGPDGRLYIALGDGGPEGDPQHKAQNIELLQGKLLRINPYADDFPLDANNDYAIPAGNPYIGVAGRDEIWALGLRNPWRCGFDRLTGDLWIGDVGQAAKEEVSFLSAGQAGVNFGWACMEGFNCRNNVDCTCNAPGLTLPIYDYPRADGVSITGGYIYRGCAIPGLQGTYFFSDWSSRKMWSLRRNGATYSNFTDNTAVIQAGAGAWSNVRSFGEDAFGEIYFTDGSAVYKILPGSPITDCNGNSRPDACDIQGGFSADANANGIPDECESCYANCDASTQPPVLNVADFTCFLQRFAAGESYANCDGSTQPPVLNVADFTCFLQRFAAGCD